MLPRLNPDVLILNLQSCVEESTCTSTDNFDQYFDGHNHTKPRRYSQQPECLLLVCSDWRRIASSCPMLWIRIELSADKANLPVLLTRAEHRIKRSGGLPLELYIDDTGVQHSHYDFEYGYKPLRQLLVRAARRMGMLEFVTHQKELGSFHSGIFESIICACLPEHFKKLIVIEKHTPPEYEDDHSQLILAFDEARAPSRRIRLELPLPKQELDSIVSGLRTLHLESIFLNWTSAAYCELVDLCLTAPATGPPYYIRESHLMSIMEASPALRTLHISLVVGYLSPDDLIISPVPLNDLEVLRIFTHSADSERFPDIEADSILRLIAPGSKPLQLTLGTRSGLQRFPLDSIHANEFFQRSRVTVLYLEDTVFFSNQLFCSGHAPYLKALVTSRCPVDFSVPPNWKSNLRSCYLHECFIPSTSLPQMVGSCPDGVVLSKCTVHKKTLDRKFEKMTREEILLAYLTVRLLEDAAVHKEEDTTVG